VSFSSSALCLAQWARSAPPSALRRLVASGLFLSALGDLLLEIGLFLAGLVAFLLADVAYALAFLSVTRRPATRPRSTTTATLARAIPFALYGAASWLFLSDGRHGRQATPLRGEANNGFGSLPLRRRAPTLAVLGDAQDLAQGRRLLRRGCAHSEMVQDAVDGEGVGDEREDAHALTAAVADERIDLVPPPRARRRRAYSKSSVRAHIFADGESGAGCNPARRPASRRSTMESSCGA
jgi:YhhN family